ncbi:MAG: hypothetical protein GY807_01710 [Gammaproteobacteria bacterium]|nr:hypothetical protein [Gammaproteobacteria bacterium]
MNLRTAMPCLIAASILSVVPPLSASPARLDDKVCQDIAGFKIIGEMEHVTFKPEQLRLQARIDTGAQTSSLGIMSQQPFERDGKKWLRFSVKDTDSEKTIDFERPLMRTVKIKQQAAEAMERPVVKLKIMLGGVEVEQEFTLADRSKFKFPVLIGRNVLVGRYIVDVNRKFSTMGMREREQ